MPASGYASKNISPTLNKEENDKSMKNKTYETILALQKQIGERTATKVLHILNGASMMQNFEKNGLMNEECTYIPFNEAMCWGEAHEEIFSPLFIEKRVCALHGTKHDYEKIVLSPLKPLFNEKFDIIVLWFGDDMFCQINMMTLLAFLEQQGFEGDVLFCMAPESDTEMLPNAYEINLPQSIDNYKSVVLEHKMPSGKLIPAMYQAVSLYLDYRLPTSKINAYIKQNIKKEKCTLVWDLLNTFSQYGLGDTQYIMMIDEELSNQSLL